MFGEREREREKERKIQAGRLTQAAKQLSKEKSKPKKKRASVPKKVGGAGQGESASAALLRHLRVAATTAVSLSRMGLKKNTVERVTEKQLVEGYAALGAVARALDAGAVPTETAFELYEAVPHHVGPQAPVDSPAMLRMKIDMLDWLWAVRSQHGGGLDVQVQALDEGDADRRRIVRAVDAAHGPTHPFSLSVTAVYRVAQGAGERRWTKAKSGDDANRRMLWCGMRPDSWVNTLQSGLQLPPAEAPAAGYKFGRGLYFADCPSKSAGLCDATPSQATHYLGVAEVALGSQRERPHASVGAGEEGYFESTLGKGRVVPNPLHEVELASVPFDCGKMQPSKNDTSSLLYNEYVVRAPSRAVVRFLVQVEFHFPSTLKNM